MIPETFVFTYVLKFHDAWKRIERTWGPLKKSLLLTMDLLRIEAFHLRGRVALAIFALDPDNEKMKADVKSCIKNISKVKTVVASALATLLEAGFIQVCGDKKKAIRTFEIAEARCKVAEMRGYAACARLQRGIARADEDGAVLVLEGSDWLREHGVENPPKFSAMFVPGAAKKKTSGLENDEEGQAADNYKSERF